MLDCCFLRDLRICNRRCTSCYCNSRPRLLRRIYGRILRHCKKIRLSGKAISIKAVSHFFIRAARTASRRLRLHCNYEAATGRMVFRCFRGGAVFHILHIGWQSIKKRQICLKKKPRHLPRLFYLLFMRGG